MISSCSETITLSYSINIHLPLKWKEIHWLKSTTLLWEASAAEKLDGCVRGPRLGCEDKDRLKEET